MKFILSMACACALMLTTGCSRPSVGQLLDKTPLWLASSSDDSSKALHDNVKEICGFPVGTLRKGLKDYLNDTKCDANTLDYRTDNARIIIAVYFNVPPDHPYRGYFDSLTDYDFSIRRPTIREFMTSKTWPDFQTVKKKAEEIMSEFDRLAGESQKTEKQQAKHPKQAKHPR